MSSPWNDGSLDCPMCGECRAFTISETDPALGFCAVENQAYRIQPGPGAQKVECSVCGRDTLRAFTRYEHNAAGRETLVCNRCARPLVIPV